MSFQEKDMQTLFGKWVKKNKHLYPRSVAWELKICKGKSLPYSRIEEHQEYYLIETSTVGTFNKLSDATPGLKHYDCYLIKGDAYIVIMFYEPRKEKIAYAIDISTWTCYKEKSSRKSITEEECAKIATKIIKL